LYLFLMTGLPAHYFCCAGSFVPSLLHFASCRRSFLTY
jgi:hypothetical protein